MILYDHGRVQARRRLYGHPIVQEPSHERRVHDLARLLTLPTGAQEITNRAQTRACLISNMSLRGAQVRPRDKHSFGDHSSAVLHCRTKCLCSIFYSSCICLFEEIQTASPKWNWEPSSAYSHLSFSDLLPLAMYESGKRRVINEIPVWRSPPANAHPIYTKIPKLQTCITLPKQRCLALN
jgi:hypothetical protein